MLLETIHLWIMSYGYIAIFLLLVLGIVGLPVPDETLLVFIGLLAFQGTFDLLPAFLSAFAGSACGISISYLLGRFGGTFLIKRYGPRFHYTEESAGRVAAWFDRVGKWMLLVGYYIPGFRHFIAFVAGSSGLKPVDLFFFAYTGAFLWVSSFMGLGYYFGKEWHLWSGRVHLYILAAAIIGVIVLLIHFLCRGKRSTG